MQKYLNILKTCPLFYGICDNELLRMLSCLGANIKPFSKKSTVSAEGSAAKNIGILLSGSLSTFQIDYCGNRNLIEAVSPPKLFLEDFACAEVDAIPVTVVATEPCEVMFIDCAHILHTCESNCAFHRQMIFNLMKILAKKTVSFHQKFEVTSKRKTREKLLAYLNLEAKKNQSASFDIPFDRQQLADYLEVDRSGLSAEISKLRDEGLLESERKHFKLNTVS